MGVENGKGKVQWLNADALLALEEYKGTGQSYSGAILDLIKTNKYLLKKRHELEGIVESFRSDVNGEI